VLRLGPKGTVRYGPVVFSPVSSDTRFDKSLPAVDLPLFKFMLEYDGDYKDVAEYVFHDIDKKEHQDRIIELFKTGRRGVGIKVLTHVDDTMYANLIDTRYPKKTLYPGVLEFYDSLQCEPFDLTTIPVTTLIGWRARSLTIKKTKSAELNLGISRCFRLCIQNTASCSSAIPGKRMH
jgi:hypothetical protein